MNYDIIREIAVQAGLDMCGCGCDMPTRQSAKFAELIIKECARIDSEANNPDHEDGVTYNQTILEHFGVKE